MNSKNDDGLYEDRFFSIMSWANSATVSLIIGGTVSLGLAIFVHWILGVVATVFTVIVAIASYIVFKK